jgi:peptide deformylase
VSETEPDIVESPNRDESSSPDPEQLARSQAALAEVLKFGDPVLRSPASPVEDFGAGLAGEIERMKRVVLDAPGSGLAAPQLGILRRLFVYRPDQGDEVRVVVNPEIEWSSEETETGLEGCLSIPDVALEIERPVSIRMRAQDEEGGEMLIEETGWTARVLQHETDHLDGVLTIDRTNPEQRKGALRALRQGESYWPPDLEDEEHADHEAPEV